MFPIHILHALSVFGLVLKHSTYQGLPDHCKKYRRRAAGAMSKAAHGLEAEKGTSKQKVITDLSLDEQLQAEALQRKLLLRKKIGSGAFSVVFEASWLAPSVMPWAATRTFAAKCLYKDQDLKRIEDELRFLRMLR